MKIISVRKGFAADHSSTSYEFLAVDKPLDSKARKKVASLSRRANPTKRRVSFIYHAEGYDIPGGWEPLMREHYDVMYSESYDWWTFAMAFDAPKEQQQPIAQYEFSGIDELGVSVACHDDRVVVSVHCRAEAEAVYRPGNEYGRWEDEYNSDYDEDDEDAEDWADEEGNSATFESGDELIDVLTRVRQQLIDGDYRALYAVWETYGLEDEGGEDVDAPPRPTDRDEGDDVVQEFRNLLAAD